MLSLADTILPRRLVVEIQSYMDRNADRRVYETTGRANKVSAKTRRERKSIVLLCYAQLWQMGYRIQTVGSLRAKHVEALAAHWLEQELSASVLGLRITVLRTLCTWLGKKDVVMETSHYFREGQSRRTSIAQSDRAWETNGVDPLEIIRRSANIDEGLGHMLALQHHFGLRVKESIEFRPAVSLIVTETETLIEVFEGTKGGRPRRVGITTPEQRQVYEAVREYAVRTNGGRVRWKGMTFAQAQARYYNLVVRVLGITKESAGVTSHGLRHGFSHRKYTDYTGLQPPIKGGNPAEIDRETHRLASMSVSSALGHCRTQITCNYYGSYGHQLRGNEIPTRHKVDVQESRYGGHSAVITLVKQTAPK